MLFTTLVLPFAVMAVVAFGYLLYATVVDFIDG